MFNYYYLGSKLEIKNVEFRRPKPVLPRACMAPDWAGDADKGGILCVTLRTLRLIVEPVPPACHTWMWRQYDN